MATWLMAIAHNLLIDHYRRGGGPGNEPIGDEGVPSDRLGETPGPEADLGLDADLAAALAALTPRDREIVAGGAGNDRILVRDGERDRVNCGSGRHDRVTADRRDRVSRNCERVSRKRT